MRYLSDYCGQFVLIEFGSFWCPYCRAEAEQQDERNETYDNFTALSLWAETNRGRTPTVEELAEFAPLVNVYDSVMGADPEGQFMKDYSGAARAVPQVVMIDPDGLALAFSTRSNSSIERAIQRYERAQSRQ